MTEGEFQARVLKRLRAFGGYWINTHGGPYQRPGIFDIIGVYRGRFVAIELKRPGKYGNPKTGLTESQWNFHSQVIAHQGIAVVADSEEPIFQALTTIDEELDGPSEIPLRQGRQARKSA